MLLTILATVLAAGDAPAPAEATPYWAEAPTVEAMTAVYPPAARAAGTGGRATLDCAVASSGRLSDCRLAQEFPEGEGFGDAALKLADHLALGPGARAAEAFPDGHARVPFIWRTGECPALAPPLAEPSAPNSTASLLSWKINLPVIRRPDWIRRPSNDAFYSVYPKRALRRELGGRAVITCKVDAEGMLAGCSILNEEPAGEGFGDAALALAPLFRMRSQTPNCEPSEGATVTIPFTWRPPQ